MRLPSTDRWICSLRLHGSFSLHGSFPAPVWMQPRSSHPAAHTLQANLAALAVQVLKKWDQLQMEVASSPNGGHGLPLARQLSCGSISSLSSASSASSAGGNCGYSGAHGAGAASSPLVTADTSRVVRHLSLSMSMISDDLTDDDEDSAADEW